MVHFAVDLRSACWEQASDLLKQEEEEIVFRDDLDEEEDARAPDGCGEGCGAGCGAQDENEEMSDKEDGDHEETSDINKESM